MHLLNKKHTFAHRQRGVGIIEVLIALLVVSIGVLGMAGLQLTGLQHSAGTFNRAKALMYAENMATRMRGNPPAVQRALFDNYNSASESCAARPAPYCQASANGAGASCTVDELARFDMAIVSCGDWGSGEPTQGVVNSLPNGTLDIACDDPCRPNSTYTVNVSWTEGQRITSDRDDVLVRQVQVRMRP